MLSKQLVDHLLIVNEISNKNLSKYTIPELIYIDHQNDFGLVSIIGYGHFSIYCLQYKKTFDFRILTLYYPLKKKCYSYCIELDIVLTSSHCIICSVEKLISSVVEFFIQSYNMSTFFYIIQMIQERCNLTRLDFIYQFISNNTLEKYFIQIKNSAHSQDRIEYLLGNNSDFLLEFYQYSIIKAQKKN